MLEQLTDNRAGRALLQVAQPREDMWLVGGAVRDLLLDRRPRELDVAVEGEVEDVALRLAGALGGQVTRHHAFGTATVSAAGDTIDLARTRTETYSEPGALPTVSPGTIVDDLRRRDFTVNAIAVALGGARREEKVAAPCALEDLAARRLRVLHEASFVDDPTRLLRMARYSARLDFTIEQTTESLAVEAVARGALATVSGARVGSEMRLILGEATGAATLALTRAQRLGVLDALRPGLHLRPADVDTAERLLGPGERADLLVLTSLLAGSTGVREWLDELAFPAADRDVVTRAAAALPGLADALCDAARPSELFAVGAAAGPIAVALAGAHGAKGPASRWLTQLRHVRLAISGDDLRAAGIEPGPDLGRRLQTTLARRLDGELEPGREAELAAALGETWHG